MVGFIVRIEMHAASYDEYEALHEAMRDVGFYKYIVSDDGRVFHLPDAEYYGLSYGPHTDVRDRMMLVADSVKPGSFVLVTQSDGIAWKLPLAS
ncbi:MAG: hypothetical protein C0481_12300 [Phenylobacterium sp.]|nr:hypothetical protein [Phenylobacterium sp.]